MYTDKTLTCVDCNQPFLFAAGEQEFFAQRGLHNQPKRCPPCRAQKRAARGAAPGNGSREPHEVVCSDCGNQTTVPFTPQPDRPVYCEPCFKVRRLAGARA